MSRLGDGGLSRGGLHRSPIYGGDGGDDGGDDGGKRFAHVVNLE